MTKPLTEAQTQHYIRCNKPIASCPICRRIMSLRAGPRDKR